MKQSISADDIKAIRSGMASLEDLIDSLSKKIDSNIEELKPLRIKVLDDSGEQVKSAIHDTLVPTMREGLESMDITAKTLENALKATGNL